MGIQKVIGHPARTVAMPPVVVVYHHPASREHERRPQLDVLLDLVIGMVAVYVQQGDLALVLLTRIDRGIPDDAEVVPAA